MDSPLPSPEPGRVPRPQRVSGGWQRWLPGVQMLRGYDIAWLRHDVVAGLVLAAMLVPAGIAYAVASGVLRSEKIGKEVWFWIDREWLLSVFGNVIEYISETT